MANTNLATTALLRILGQWNRWGEARLESGRPREVVEKLGPFLDTLRSEPATGKPAPEPVAGRRPDHTPRGREGNLVLPARI